MTTLDTGASAYLRTRVLTASPEELRLLLLEGAIRFARQGRDGLSARNYEQSFEGLSKSREIIAELIATMRPEHDPQLCERVRSVYTFLFNELIEASVRKEPARVDAVIELLEYERETWVLLMDRLREERGEAGTSAGDAAPGGMPGATAAGTKASSIEPRPPRPALHPPGPVRESLPAARRAISFEA